MTERASVVALALEREGEGMRAVIVQSALVMCDQRGDAPIRFDVFVVTSKAIDDWTRGAALGKRRKRI